MKEIFTKIIEVFNTEYSVLIILLLIGVIIPIMVKLLESLLNESFRMFIIIVALVAITFFALDLLSTIQAVIESPVVKFFGYLLIFLSIQISLYFMGMRSQLLGNKPTN